VGLIRDFKKVSKSVWIKELEEYCKSKAITPDQKATIIEGINKMCNLGNDYIWDVNSEYIKDMKKLGDKSAGFAHVFEGFIEKDASVSNDKPMRNDDTSAGAKAAGVVYGNVSAAGIAYGLDKFATPRGHGFAAERANHLHDVISGKDAVLVGDNNVKHGADRLVDGIAIQSKYCNSGSKCVAECFQDGRFKYVNPDGSAMQIEVPSDKYDAAVKAMEDRISKGQVEGVTDPKEASNIVRKGHYTYAQARNIAKFGTIESITFDAVNGVIVAGITTGISAAMSFAVAVWNGEDFDIALKKSATIGLKVGGTTFLTVVLSSQLSKAGLNSFLMGSSQQLVKLMGPKASAVIANALRTGGTQIYGAAAMNNVAKLLRGNIITGAISVVVLSGVDVANIFRGRISGAQLFKNVTGTVASVAGGAAGYVGGAAAGAAIGSVVPVVGTAIGFGVGLMGAFLGGSVANKATKAAMDTFIEDDANKMVEIIEKRFVQLCEDYLLNQKEVEEVVSQLGSTMSGGTLKDMFASGDRNLFADNLLIPMIEPIVTQRSKVTLPTLAQMNDGLRMVLEDIADEKDLDAQEKSPMLTSGLVP
jgi:hypothetical protein